MIRLAKAFLEHLEGWAEIAPNDSIELDRTRAWVIEVREWNTEAIVRKFVIQTEDEGPGQNCDAPATRGSKLTTTDRDGAMRAGFSIEECWLKTLTKGGKL